MAQRNLLFIAALVLATFVGCQQAPPPQQGMWKGKLEMAGNKQLPFLMYLNLSQPAPWGYFLNGTEQTPIPEIYYRGDSVIFLFSEYGAAMHAVWKSGRFAGEFVRYRNDTVANTFEAVPLGASEQTPKEIPTAQVPLVGTFRAFFTQKDGIDTSSQATFWARGDSVFGTIVETSGDLGLMAGKQSGDSVVLTRFTGWQGQIVELTREQNSWKGVLTYRVPPPATFSLESRARLTKELPLSERPSMKQPRSPFTFSGVTVMGDTITNRSAQFKGKVVLVDIMGTWCHNCMDAAPLLQKLYAEFSGQGLEIVGLTFELSDDAARWRKNLLMFEERYGITFPILFCGTTKPANTEQKIKSQMNNFPGYPTTLFIDRKGTVRRIHGGFNGPGTGDAYQVQVNEYYETVRSLLKERAAVR